MSYTRAYHYTTFKAMNGIVESRHIRRSTTFNNEVDAVWFSTSPVFEHGSGMHATKGKEVREVSWEQLTQKIGIARFATDAGLLVPYGEAITKGLVKPWAAQCNAECAGRYGNTTDDWLIHPGADFPLSLCTGADLYLRGGWVPLTPETMTEMGALLPRVLGATWEDVFGKKPRRIPKKRTRKK